MKILIAEDDPVSALVLRRALERKGHEVTLAVDGLAAWECVAQERPQILISDWMMPGMDGPELCRRVRATANEADGYTYLIMLTAKAQDADRDVAIAAGVDDFLAKPLNRLELSARLRVAERILAWQERVRRAGEELAEGEVRYRETFESFHDVYYKADATGAFVLLSPSCLPHTGYAPAELVGQSVALLFPNGTDFAGMVDAIRLGDTINDYEAQLQRKDGTNTTVSLNVETARDSAGAITGFQGTMRDVQARKNAEDERDRIFTLSVDMLCLLEPDFTVRAANPAWLATLGVPPETVTGQRFQELINSEGRPIGRQAAYVLYDGNGLLGARCLMRHADGSDRWIEWNASPPSETGLTYAVGRDVTAAVRAQAEMEEVLAALSASAQSLSEQAVELDRLRVEAEYVANHDMLTGAINRRAWFAQAPDAKPCAVAVFDIDFFKRVNDTHGHPIGDLVLREVAWRLEGMMSDGAAIGRVGGEEFAAYFVGSFPAARAMAEAAIEAIAASPITLPSGELLPVTISGGLAPWTGGSTPEEALANSYDEADRALYAAKSGGRNRLTVYGRRAAA